MKEDFKKPLGKDAPSTFDPPPQYNRHLLLRVNPRDPRPKTRILLTKSLPHDTAQHMPFTILICLMTSFAAVIFEEFRIYGVDYALYRDPVHTYDVLTISVERMFGDSISGRGEPEGGLAEEKLTYADCMSLENGVRGFLGRVVDETVEVEVYRRGGKRAGDVLVGRGRVGSVLSL